MEQVQSPDRKSSTLETWQFTEGDHEFLAITSWNDLESILTSMPQWASTPNAIGTLIAPSGDSLAIGIAGAGDCDNPTLTSPLATVEFFPASYAESPSSISAVAVGVPNLGLDSSDVAVFRFQGQWTEILQRQCLPVTSMLQIAKYFYETGQLSQEFAWEAP